MTTKHTKVRFRPQASRLWVRLAGLFIAATMFSGCNRNAEIRDIIDATTAYCDANPVPAFPAPVSADSVYVGAGALTQSWQNWIPKALLHKGFTTVESAASIAPEVAGAGDYLRFRIAPISDPGCAGQRAIAGGMEPAAWQKVHRNLTDIGLRADQCLAVERVARRQSRYWLEVWDASAELDDPGFGIPVNRQRYRFKAIEAANGRVMHEHVSEYGFVEISMSAPFGCLRRQEWERFTDGIVLGAATKPSAVPQGPQIIENPPSVRVQAAVPIVELTRDLGRTTIDGYSLEQRRARTREATVVGIEILEGTSTKHYETSPGWPRYLQLAVDGQYRRVRLAWLEGTPHGYHDRPVRVFDLGDRIGLFAVTSRVSPGTRGATQLSWAELSRTTGLPILRAEASVPIDAALEVSSIIENVQRLPEGLRFSVTEIGSPLGQEAVLLREAKYLWPLE